MLNIPVVVRRNLSLMLSGLLFLAAALYFSQAMSQAPQTKMPGVAFDRKLKVKKGMAFPDFALADQSGKERTPSDTLSSQKPNLVIFSKSTCSVCLTQLKKVKAAVEPGTINYVVVSTSKEDNFEKYSEILGSEYTWLDDSDGRFAKKIGGRGVPVSMIIGKDQKVIHAQFGMVARGEENHDLLSKKLLEVTKNR